MKFYLITVAGVALLAGIAYSHSMAYRAGKDSVLTELKDSRITILKDGRKIDEEVLSADDDALFCMLVDCSVQPDGGTN